MEYLVSTTEVYRVDDETSATSLIEKAKHDSMYELAKYSSVKKEKKQKGEIIDEWYQVSLTKKFNDEKDPISVVNIKYGEQIDF
jgi:hypothetical protein